jgi:hypothetical protein
MLMMLFRVVVKRTQHFCHQARRVGVYIHNISLQVPYNWAPASSGWVARWASIYGHACAAPPLTSTTGRRPHRTPPSPLMAVHALFVVSSSNTPCTTASRSTTLMEPGSNPRRPPHARSSACRRSPAGSFPAPPAAPTHPRPVGHPI